MAHILLVEDDADVVQFTIALLEKHGHTVEVAGNGEAALVAYMTRRPDLILLDVFVPRIDGLRLAREVRGRFPGDRAPIVVWTGAYEPERMGDLVQTPHVLPKPVASEELLEVVHRALHLDTRKDAPRVLAVSAGAARLRELIRELRQDFDVHAALGWEEVAELTERRPFRAIIVDVGVEPAGGGEAGEDSYGGAAVLREVASRDGSITRVAVVEDEAAGRALLASGAVATVLPRPLAPGVLSDRLRAILR